MIKLAFIGQHFGFDAIQYIASSETIRIAFDDGHEILVDVEDVNVSLALASYKGDTKTSHLTVDISSGTRLFIPFDKSRFNDAYEKVEGFAKQWEADRGRIVNRPKRKPRAYRRGKESVN